MFHPAPVQPVPQTSAYRWRQALALLALTGWLVACQPAISKSTATQPVGSPVSITGEAQHTPTHQPEPTAGPTLVLQPEMTSATQPVATPLDTPAFDPLRFVFPTPGLEPLSAWRPPLYPIPWAPTPFDHFYFARPIAANDVNWPSANYRYGGEFFENVVHNGVDIPAETGTPVLAAGAGRVVWVGYGLYRGSYDPNDPYGLAVVIRHDFGYQDQALYTVYGHLSQIDVAEGQYLDTGDPLGLVGETGNVTGSHLHFEVRLGENSYFNTRNPELWIVPPIGWGVLVGRVTDSFGSLVAGQQFIITEPDTRENRFARSYGAESVNQDPYYRENLVMGDLPAGIYLLRVAYVGINYTVPIEIKPGLVTYFTFRGRDGITLREPRLPGFEPLGTATPVP